MAPHPPHHQPSKLTIAKVHAPWRSTSSSAPPASCDTSGGALLRSSGIKRKQAAAEKISKNSLSASAAETGARSGGEPVQAGAVNLQQKEKQVEHEQASSSSAVGGRQPTPGELAFQVLAEIAAETGLQPAQPKKRPFVPAPGDISRVAGTGFSKAAMATQQRRAVQLSPSPFQHRVPPPPGWVFSTPPQPVPLIANTSATGIDWDDI